MNHLYPPFDNKLLRQAAIAAVSQEDVLKALVGNPKYYRTCAAVMGCGNPMGDNYGEDWVVPARIDRAQALLKEAGYDGTPVVILQPSDIAMVSPQPVVVGAALRKAGFKVVMKAMDWQSVVSQQGNQKSPADGGWNIFSTYSILATSGDPFGNTTLAANGRKAWAGWPDVPEIEALRLKYAKAADIAERKQIAAQIQKLAIDEGVVAPWGSSRFRRPTARSCRACWTRRSLCSGISGSEVPEALRASQERRSGPAEPDPRGPERATLPRMATIKELPRMMTIKETACPPSMTC